MINKLRKIKYVILWILMYLLNGINIVKIKYKKNLE